MGHDEVELLNVGIENDDRYGLLTPVADRCATSTSDPLLPHNFVFLSFFLLLFFLNNGDVTMLAPRLLSGTLS